MAGRTTTGCAAAAVAALLLAVLSPLPVQAAPTWVLPPAPIPGDRASAPVAGVLPDGGALLVYLAATPGADAVWSTDRPPGGTWAEKVQVSDTGGQSTEPRVVVDSAGNATAIWRYLGYTASTTAIHAAFRPAGGTWGPPTPLSAATANAFTPDLTVDAAGTVTAVWVIVEGMGVRYVQSATRTLGGAWSAPETRSVGYADEPTVAAGPAGSVVLAYVRHDSGQSQVDITTRDPSGTWTAPTPISALSGFTEPPQAAMDIGGRALVGWSRYEPPFQVVQVSERSPAGTWSSALDLSAIPGDAGGVQVALNQTGHAVAGWHHEDGAFDRAQVSTHAPGGAWEAPATLSAAGQDAVMRAVTIDSAAGVTAAWTRVNSAAVPVVQASHRPAGGSWTPVTDLSAGAVETYPGGLAVDAAGDVVVPLALVTTPFVRVEATALDVAGPALGTYTVPAKGIAGSATSFAATATDTWSSVASYAWTFGDGATASGANVSHTYAKQGGYTVTLTVTDAVGNATTRTSTTTVAAAIPRIGTFKLTESKISALSRHAGFETVVTDLLNQRLATKTKLKVKLNTASTLKLVFKSKHKHLVKGKKKYLKVVVRKQLPAGLSKITVKAKVKGKKLKPDTYVITGTAKNSSGTSPQKKAKLKVVR